MSKPDAVSRREYLKTPTLLREDLAWGPPVNITEDWILNRTPPPTPDLVVCGLNGDEVYLWNPNEKLWVSHTAPRVLPDLVNFTDEDLTNELTIRGYEITKKGDSNGN